MILDEFPLPLKPHYLATAVYGEQVTRMELAKARHQFYGARVFEVGRDGALHHVQGGSVQIVLLEQAGSALHDEILWLSAIEGHA
jgi:hypothetical protein